MVHQPTRCRQYLWVLVAFACLSLAAPVAAQDITGPITALWADGSRLLVGQGSILLETQITPAALTRWQRIDLKHGEIRDIAGAGPFSFVVTMDGLLSLYRRGELLDFVPGGGVRLLVQEQRLYVAALAGGLRVYSYDGAGRITLLAHITLQDKAWDLAAGGADSVWVAQGEAGLQRYDLTNPAQPGPRESITDLVPAQTVHVAADRLIVGHGDTLSVLDMAGTLLAELDIGTARIMDLAAQGSRIFVGLQDESGPDAVIVSLFGEAAISAEIGSSGGGHRVALSGDDLFIGSPTGGLRRFAVGRGDPALLSTWGAAQTGEGCSAQTPYDPQPANLGVVPPGLVTLSWQGACATTYELYLNEQPLGQLSGETHSHTFSMPRTVNTWRIVAVDAAGNRASSPLWRFELGADQWMASPRPLNSVAVIYAPPLLQSQEAIILATCGAFLGGMLAIVIVAWLIGLRAQTRSSSLS